MGVLFHEGSVGGASQTLLRIVPALAERGWDLRFYVDQPGGIADRLRDLGYETEGRRRHVGFSRRWLAHDPGPRVKVAAMGGWFAGLASWLRRTRPALVHANSLYTLPDALLARSLGAPVYLQLLEMLPDGVKGRIARAAILRAGIVPGAVSDASGRRFARPGEPLPAIVRTGVPLPERPAHRPDAPVPLVVGTLGQVGERKGSDVFVEMARIMRRERDDVEFRLVGPLPTDAQQPRGEEIVAAARAAGIHYSPFARPYDELTGWDVSVLPSRFDPYPLVVMESMAIGVATVASGVDGILEQIAPGTGLLAEPGDPVDLADKVLTLLDDPALRARLAAAGRERALKHFTLEAQTDALEAVWRRTAAREPV